MFVKDLVLNFDANLVGLFAANGYFRFLFFVVNLIVHSSFLVFSKIGVRYS